MPVRNIIFSICLTLLSLTASASDIFDDVAWKGRLGYSIGGVAPVGLPATIRGLNNYRLQPNLSIGVDATKPIKRQWSLLLGLHFENKGMNEDARVKNYYEQIERGSERLEGRFTGDVTTIVREWMFTVPLQAVWHANDHLNLRVGPYVSYLTSKSFTGYAHNGYLRVGDPTGPKVILGNDVENRGSYDFSDNMRRMQCGVALGADLHLRDRLGAYADLSWGLSGVHNGDFKVIEQTLYPIFGTIGLTYTIK